MPEIFTPLSPDEPISVVALSGPADPEMLERGLATLRSWGRPVVFLEDVNEPMYRLDRLLTQMKSSGMLEGVKALISGDLRDCEPKSAPRWRDLLLESVPDGVPVVYGLSFGHGPANLAFPVGACVEVDTDAGALIWRT